jgi:hypothetical protein
MSSCGLFALVFRAFLAGLVVLVNEDGTFGFFSQYLPWTLCFLGLLLVYRSPDLQSQHEHHQLQLTTIKKSQRPSLTGSGTRD